MPTPLTRLRLACVALAVLATSATLAETSPYYLGVSATLAHDSNLYRLGEGALPASVKSRSDTSTTTALVAGVDQTWGRQRLSGSGSLRSSRFSRNEQLNNTGHGLNLALDWATVERLSGTLRISSDRSLRRFDPAYETAIGLDRNIEDNTLITGTVRLGVVTRLTAEGTLSRRAVRFSADAYKGSEYNEGVGSLGLRYRLGGATTVGLAWRQARVRQVSGNDPYNRRNIDLTGTWDPSALTTVYARVSHSSTEHSRQPQYDFSGFTGELRGSTQVTGKIKLSTRLSRDTGQSYSTVDFSGFTSATEFNRQTTALRLAADYGFSNKISVNANLENARRNLSGTLTAISGSDRTTTASVGARWLPTRATQLGCDVSREQRSVSSDGITTVGRAYGSTGLSCYGQFVLQ